MLTGTHAFQKIPDGNCSDWDDRTTKCPIKKAVDEYLNNATITKYGPIKDWDTSLVTDMSSLFDADPIEDSEAHIHRKAFNGDISKWETGAVTNMYASKL